MPLSCILKYLLLTGFLLSFSFKEKREIKIPFSSEKILVLRDKIVLFSNGSLYFINKNGKIVFSVPVFGFEKGRVSDFLDFESFEDEVFILGKEKVLRYNSHGELINEFHINLPQPSFIGVSFPFGIFLFDKSLNKVKRYDFEGKEKGEFYVKDNDIKDIEIDGDYIYFLTKHGKVLIYNFYGNRVKEFKLVPGNKIKIMNDLIFVLDDENLRVFKDKKEIYSENIKAEDFYVDNENLYILFDNKIEIRRFGE